MTCVGLWGYSWGPRELPGIGGSASGRRVVTIDIRADSRGFTCACGHSRAGMVCMICVGLEWSHNMDVDLLRGCMWHPGPRFNRINKDTHTNRLQLLFRKTIRKNSKVKRAWLGVMGDRPGSPSRVPRELPGVGGPGLGEAGLYIIGATSLMTIHILFGRLVWISWPHCPYLRPTLRAALRPTASSSDAPAVFSGKLSSLNASCVFLFKSLDFCVIHVFSEDLFVRGLFKEYILCLL
jgi:hypothetical protein